MKFAGFMSALKDERIRKEDAEAEKAKEDRSYAEQLARDERQFGYQNARDEAEYVRQTGLKSHTHYLEQRQKDAKLNGDVNTFMETAGIPAEQRSYWAGTVESYGLAKATEMFNSGQLQYDAGSGAAHSVTSSLTGDMALYADSIAAVESRGSGDYSAVGPVVAKGMYAGDRAYGRYQVMGLNIPDWTERYFGQRLTPQQYVANTDAQDAVFAGHFSAAMETHGSPQDAASVWFTGQPHSRGGNRSDGYITGNTYVAKFDNAMSALSGSSRYAQAPVDGTDTQTAEAFAIPEDRPDSFTGEGTRVASTDATQVGDQPSAQDRGATPVPYSMGTPVEDAPATSGLAAPEDEPYRAPGVRLRRPEPKIDDTRGNDWFAAQIGSATTSEKLNALNAEIEYTTRLTPDEKKMAREGLQRQVGTIADMERKEAARTGEWLDFSPYDETGNLVDPVKIRHDGTKWVDDGGNPVDITRGFTADATTVLAERKVHNTQIGDITKVVSSGVQALDSIDTLRQLVIENPSAVNRYVSIANNVASTIKSLGAAANGIFSGNDFIQYDYNTVENELFTSLGNLAAEDAAVASAMLRAAYDMAAARGSSGQALSDKELEKNLAGVGMGLTDPRKIVGLLNDAARGMIQMTDGARRTGWEGITMSPEIKNVVGKQNSIFVSDFEDYYRNRIIGDDEVRARHFQEMMEDKTDYNYVVRNDSMAPPRAQTSLMGPENDVDLTRTREGINTAISEGRTITVTEAMLEALPKWRENFAVGQILKFGGSD